MEVENVPPSASFSSGLRIGTVQSVRRRSRASNRIDETLGGQQIEMYAAGLVVAITIRIGHAVDLVRDRRLLIQESS